LTTRKALNPSAGAIAASIVMTSFRGSGLFRSTPGPVLPVNTPSMALFVPLPFPFLILVSFYGFYMRFLAWGKNLAKILSFDLVFGAKLAETYTR
jgi:hypothetical protein